MIAPDVLQTLINWIAAIATLAILSVVYRENPFYRFFEHLFVGVATGYGVFIVWRDALQETWWAPISGGGWYWILAPLLALLYYTIYSPKYAWLSRFWISIMFGLGAGAAFRGFANQVFPQVGASFLPLIPGEGLTWTEALNNLVFIGTLLAVMVYFFFSFRHENKVVSGTARVGRWLLMIAFGAIFGSTVMARFSLLIDRIHFLLADWLHWIR